MNKNRIYVAYGSNLNIRGMSLRCPEAEVIGKAEIKDYQMLFRGFKADIYATIEPCVGKNVPVVLWAITSKDEIALDIYEEYPIFYYKENITLMLDNKEINAFAYIMTDGQPLGIPSRRYFNTIMEGYKDADFNVKILEKFLFETMELMKQKNV
ncbi:MAG: gamma-glutamylcyclotransferase family protein [Anaerotignaceae bacterium]